MRLKSFVVIPSTSTTVLSLVHLYYKLFVERICNRLCFVLGKTLQHCTPWWFRVDNRGWQSPEHCTVKSRLCRKGAYMGGAAGRWKVPTWCVDHAWNEEKNWFRKISDKGMMKKSLNQYVVENNSVYSICVTLLLVCHRFKGQTFRGLNVAWSVWPVVSAELAAS